VAPEKSWDQAIQRLDAVEAAAASGGGEAQLDRLRKNGRLTARERIDHILDDGSFVELNRLAEHQCHDFGMADKKYPGDGVITGYGTINGRKVFIYAQDETVLGGSSGKTHGSKIHYVLRLARETLAPVICLNSSPGARIQEGTDNVYGVTGMFRENALNSGVVPQISAIMGTCSGAAAYSSALCDFVIQVEKDSYLFLTGPPVIREVTGEEVSFAELGSAGVHSTRSGVVHLTARDDRDCLEQIRRLLDFLPQNNLEKPQKKSSRDPVDRQVPELLDIVPITTSTAYDMKEVIRVIVDDGDFFEIQADFAGNLVVGYARLAGAVVGVVANNPDIGGGWLDIAQSGALRPDLRFVQHSVDLARGRARLPTRSPRGTRWDHPSWRENALRVDRGHRTEDRDRPETDVWRCHTGHGGTRGRFRPGLRLARRRNAGHPCRAGGQDSVSPGTAGGRRRDLSLRAEGQGLPGDVSDALPRIVAIRHRCRDQTP